MSTTQLGLTGTPSKKYSVTPKRAATTITKTIGTSSRDYSTITAWEADLDNTLVYVSGDDAVGECYNDSTFTEANVLINGGGTVSLNTITLTVAETERHDGTSASGVYWGNSQAGNMLELSSTGIDTEISWLDLYKSSDPSGSTTMILANTSDAHTIKNNIVRDCTVTAGAMSGIIVSGNSHIVMNNFVYNLSQNQNSSSGLIGIGTLAVNSASYYNNTIANLVNDQGSGFCLGVDAGSSATVTNCISMSTTGTSSGNKFNFGLDTAETFSMSEDTSANGSNCLNNKVYADQFVSTASGSEDLHLKAGSDAIGAGTDLGTTPDGVQYDIDGVDRDARGTTWDMGADQAAGTVGKTIGTSSRDYSTMTLWEADLDDTTIYQSGDDAVGECYNDSTFTNGVDITIARTDLSSMTLKAADGEGHDGTSGTGVVINTTAPNHIRYRDAHVPLIVERIELAGSTIAIRTNRLATYKRMLIHNSGSTFATEGGQEPATLMNSIIYTATTGPSCLGHKNYNNTIYNMTNDGVSGAVAANGGEVKNTISVGNGGEDFDTGTAQTESYCMSSDTTASGTGSITSVVTADQFVSIVGGSEDLHLKAGADAIGAGTDLGTSPAGVQYDIDGVDRDARGTTWDMGADQAAGTVGKTIGTSSRDYSTMTLWEADLDDTTIYQSGDDAVGECYNDSVFTEGNLIINGGSTVGLNSIELTVAETERHDGTSGTGARWGNATTGTLILLNSNSDQTISWLDLYKTSDLNDTTSFILINTNVGDNTVRNNLIGNCRSTFGFVRGVYVFGNDHFIYNNIVYNLEQDSSTSSDCTGFSTAGGNATYYNNTAVNIKNNQGTGDANGFQTGSSSVVTNCIAMDTGGTATGSLVNIATVNETFSMSEDSSASGANCLANKVYADQFVSTVVGSEDLHLKAGSDAIGAGTDLGTTPDGVQYDIDGVDRDARGTTWDIGADQAAGTVGKTIGTAARDYSTMTLWEADLDVATIYQSGDDAVGECYNDSVFSVTSQIRIDGGATVGLNSITLTVAETEKHDGTAGTGAKIEATVESLTGTIYMSTNIYITVSWLELEYVGSANNTYVAGVLSTGSSTNRTVSHMIIHELIGKRSITGTGACNCLNNIIYNIETTNLSSDPAAGINMSNSNWYIDYTIANNTVYNVIKPPTSSFPLSAFGIRYATRTATNSGFVKNNIAVGAETDYNRIDNSGDLSEVTNNISSDATAVGTDDITGVVIADQFVSIVGGSEDLHLKAGADAIGAGTDLGTTPDGVQYDIDGVDRDARGTTWDIGADQAAGTVGKTIGTSSRDYSTMTLWEADLDSAGYQSGDDAVGECYNDSTFDESVIIDSGGTVGLSSLVLTVADGEKHDGTAGTGARIVRTVGGTTIITASIDGMELSWLEIDCNENATGVTAISSQEQGQRHSNLICHGGRRDTGGVLLAWDRAAVGGTTNNCSLLNSIFYNFGWITSGSGGSFSAIHSISSVREIDIANCTLFKIFADDTSGGVKGVDIREDADSSIKNTIAVSVTNTGSGSAACFDTYSVTDTSNNLSSDATAPGTNSLLNKSSDQFVSIVGGSEDLHLKAGSDAIGAGTDLGTTPDGVNIDIDGFDRNSIDVNWDIGAHQFTTTLSNISNALVAFFLDF